MRPLERKIFGKIKDTPITLDNVEEWLDRIDRTEKKKSYPDESHFQNDRYFARLILDSLTRRGLLTRNGSSWQKPQKNAE